MGNTDIVAAPQDIYNEPVNRYVANFIGESNIVSGRMLEDKKVRFDDITFDCVDVGFKENEPVEVVIRPEDIDIVKAGQQIPADGEVIEGAASVDESAITGESAPVIRESGGVTGGKWLRLNELICAKSASNKEK